MSRSSTARNRYANSTFAKLNAARRLAASVTPLRHTDEHRALLAKHGIRVPVTTLAEYHEQAPAATAQIDAGREPYLFNGELLALDMHPLVAVWDVSSEKHGDAIMTSTAQGDALLAPETLIAWR